MPVYWVQRNNMLRLFTELLRDFLIRQAIAPADRIFLDPPDRTFAQNLPTPGQSVNVYLADLRENRKFRTTERQRKIEAGGNVTESLYPSWVDAHYLISVWDASNNPSDRRRPLREQEVLSAISAAFLAGDPLTPAAVYPTPTDAELTAIGALAGSPLEATLIQTRRDQLEAWPTEFRVPGLPFQVLPPEGFPKLSEFWTTMGQGTVWRPVVYLVASVPVFVAPTFTSPMVTTLTSRTGQTDDAPGRKLVPGTEHFWHQIGGFVHGPVLVRDPNDPDFFTKVRRPLINARVVLQLTGDPGAIPPTTTVSVQETRTNARGQYQFEFAGLPPEPGPPKRRYQVVVRVAGLQAPPLDVDLSPLTPLPHDIEMVEPTP
jgi:hypothetical protein